MNKIIRLGVDLAKEKIQVYAEDNAGREIFNKQMSRAKFINFMQTTEVCKVAMESCGSSNYYARKFKSIGHEVSLIAPQYVKAFLKRNKNDKNDAEAIATASKQKNMYFVTPKEVWQQDINAIHVIRERYIKDKTALSNELRGLLAERGIFINKGDKALRDVLIKIGTYTEENKETELSELIINLIRDLLEEYREIEKRIQKLEAILKTISNENEICKRLEEIPGVGIITSTAVVATLGHNAHQFKNGRQFSAFLGLVPKQHSSGGKPRLGRISKRGDKYLRKLLVHGARSVVRVCELKNDTRNIWITKKKKERSWNKACVAVANKNARIMLSLVKNNTKYKVDFNSYNKKAS